MVADLPVHQTGINIPQIYIKYIHCNVKTLKMMATAITCISIFSVDQASKTHSISQQFVLIAFNFNNCPIRIINIGSKRKSAFEHSSWLWGKISDTRYTQVIHTYLTFGHMRRSDHTCIYVMYCELSLVMITTYSVRSIRSSSTNTVTTAAGSYQPPAKQSPAKRQQQQHRSSVYTVSERLVKSVFPTNFLHFDFYCPILFYLSFLAFKT